MSKSRKSASLSRRNFVHLSATGAAAAMLFGLPGCIPGTESENSASTFTAGTYTGRGEGKGGPMTIKVVFGDSLIESVEVVEHAETRFISDMALAEIPAQIVEYQSLGIDTITGATLSSMAILQGVRDCTEQAGGNVSALERVSAREKVDEIIELDADVVVVGAGISGMTAAIAAAQSGAKKVVVLEKTSNMGGNALVSGGFVHYVLPPDELRATMNEGYEAYFDKIIAKGFEQGPAEGIEPSFVEGVVKEYDDFYATGATGVFDSKNFLALDYQFLNGGTFESWVNYAELLPDMNTWLTDMGIEWQKLASIVGFAWPRWSAPVGGHLGEGYFDLFKGELDKSSLPITLITLTPAEELIIEDGKVIGVVGQNDDGSTYRISASKGVILATGGYAGNPEMLKKYNKFWDWDENTVIPTTNAYGHTGDGIEMSVNAGAAIEYMEMPMVLPFADVKDFSVETFVGNPSDCPLVNKEGKRFVDESLDRFSISAAIMKQPENIIYAISDSVNCLIQDGITYGGAQESLLLERGQLLKADTLEELAGLIGADPETLVSTIDAFNGYADTHKDEEFGRTVFTDFARVSTGPFYASPRTWAAHITLGGVVVDDSNYQAVDEGGNPIEGLYCIGELVAERSGVHCMATGLRAARALFEVV